MRILITGSRDWDDYWRIQDALSEQYHCWEHEDCGIPYTVVSGACPSGADRMCEDWAKALGWNVERHPAEWTKHTLDCPEWHDPLPTCKSAGFRRNAEMVKLGADVCLAFIKNGSKGATMTANLAEKAGIPVKRYEVNATE